MANLVPVNERGIPIGQYHHRSKVSDSVVDEMRDLHEIRKLSYGQLSLKFKLPYHYVKKVCLYQRRVQIPYDWRNAKTVTGSTNSSGGNANGNTIWRSGERHAE